MENDEESLRLDLKTRRDVVEKQALFAGIKPGMRVIDMGCGSGKTTSLLACPYTAWGKRLGSIYPRTGSVMPLTIMEGKAYVLFAWTMRDPLDNLGEFDFLWIRFVLEYYRADAWSIVQHVTRILKPGGILCLIDLDYNCMTHFEMPERLERTTQEIIEMAQIKANFDPYAGRKLYSYLYKLDFTDIRVHVGAHHLIYGNLGTTDAYNWAKKLEVAGKKIGFDFHRYGSGYDGYVEEFKAFFNDPSRFTYTPLISACGRKSNSCPIPTK